MFECPHCHGKIMYSGNFHKHVREEENIYLKGKENEDYVVCKVCGLRCQSLKGHLRSHKMNSDDYRKKFGNDVLISCFCYDDETGKAISEGLKREAGDHVKDKPCQYCGEIVNHRYIWEHYQNSCTKARELMKEGLDYVSCPECGKWADEISAHLVAKHRLGKYERKQKYPGLKMHSDRYAQKMKQTNLERYGNEVAIRSDIVQAKVKKTWQERYGTDNPWKNTEVREKTRQTMQERYGVDHMAQSPELYAKVLSKKGYTTPERFLDEHTCDNVVCVGKSYPELNNEGLPYFVGFKKPVVKGDKTHLAGYPDFVILTDDQLIEMRAWLDKAKSGDRDDCPFRRKKNAVRTSFVIEVFGDHWHDEKKTGVENDDHEQQVLEAYKSVNVSCLILWEHELTEEDWNGGMREKVETFVKLALESSRLLAEQHAITREAESVDHRVATLPCPYGSGKLFRTQESLDVWLKDPENWYRPGLIEGQDYVVCPECGYRARTLVRHMRREHGTETDLAIASVRENKSVALAGKTRGPYNVPHKDPFAGQIEGQDYVVCALCGFKAKWLTRHVRREHGEVALKDYGGQLVASRAQERANEAADLAWATRRAVIGGAGYKRLS